MISSRAAFLFFSVLAPLCLAAPTELTKRVSDAPYSVSAATVQAAITCPRGIQGKAGGVVFLVHGTGSTGAESWENGPYNQVLPTAGKTYDICWVDLPGRSLVDAQISAEYVARGIQYLAPKSATGKVSIIGHSQGAGFNPQWALIFWPSVQKYVQAYIALAGDFHGTAEGILLCNAVTMGASCEPSVWQQTVGSHYLAAQNSLLPGGGGRALVPTTSVYTIEDDVIQPELPPLGPTSYLQGAGVHALQDVNVCGPTHVADHFTMIIDTAAYGLALTTLEYGAPVAISKFNPLYCFAYSSTKTYNFTDVAADLRSAVEDVLAFGYEPKSQTEPSLQPYVCQRGFATSCGPAFASSS